MEVVEVRNGGCVVWTGGGRRYGMAVVWHGLGLRVQYGLRVGVSSSAAHIHVHVPRGHAHCHPGRRVCTVHVLCTAIHTVLYCTEEDAMYTIACNSEGVR